MNPVRKKIRDLIIGPAQFISSTVQYRNAMLRGLIGLAVICAGVIYIGLDFYNGITGRFQWHALLLILALFSFLLNRFKRYTLSSMVLVILSNGMIFIFASSEDPGVGNFFFFMTTGLGSLVLFGYRNRNLGLFLMLITYVLAILAYSGWFQIKPISVFTEGYIRMSFVTNFTMAYLIAILMTYFSLQLHHDTEASLRTSEQSLMLTSKELKSSRERFKMAVEGSRAGLYEWNRRDNTLYVSPQYEKMLGYSENELANITAEAWLDMIHPEDRSRLNDSMVRHFSTQQPYQTELRIRTRGGSYKWISDSGISKFNNKGEQLVIVGSIIDIDERKMAEQQIRLQNELLAKANDELDRFVYSASHDLRAPLSSLLGLISVAEMTERQEEIRLCLDMMKKRVLTMEGFIKEITDYSRNSRLKVDRQRVRVHRLVQDILESLRFINGADKIQLQLHLANDLEFETDENRLKVILNNLIANAIKYHDSRKDRPFIKIGAERNGHECAITIEDNGLGIAPEHLDSIFNMFYRASELSEGSGLGLYIVKETLAKLGGSISVDSVLHQGSVFTVRLPAG